MPTPARSTPLAAPVQIRNIVLGVVLANSVRAVGPSYLTLQGTHKVDAIRFEWNLSGATSYALELVAVQVARHPFGSPAGVPHTSRAHTVLVDCFERVASSALKF